MPTARDTTTEIQELQEKLLVNLETSQKAVVTLVGTWAETVDTLFSKLPELTVTEPFRPMQAMENVFGFTEKVLASQRDFANQMYQAAVPATRAPASTAQAARSAASSKG